MNLREDFCFQLLSTISENLIESHDSTIPLRSNGNQALAMKSKIR